MEQWQVPVVGQGTGMSTPTESIWPPDRNDRRGAWICGWSSKSTKLFLLQTPLYHQLPKQKIRKDVLPAATDKPVMLFQAVPLGAIILHGSSLSSRS